MQQKVENYIQKNQLLNHNQPVVVGVSGGTDSMVLLHILIALGYECIVAHCNFHLRMEESDNDELFVRNYATNHKLMYYCIDFDTIMYAEKNRISIEMAARELRYNWFNELIQNHNAQAVTVAHHADDSIETLLMNLVRGTGLKGLTGIQPRNENVVRPLLCLTRLQIEEYLVQHDLDHIEDSSNASSAYKRNKFRNEVLPLLEEINPSVRQTLYDSLERFEGTYSIYQQAIDKIENEIVEKSDVLIKIDIPALKLHSNLLTVLYEILNKYGFTVTQIKQIQEQLDGESGKMFYSDSHVLLKDRNQLIISAKTFKSRSTYYISQNDAEITEPLNICISRFSLNTDFKVSKANKCVQLDASKLKFPLLLRHWQEGDSFYPFGMNQRKKLSDFFIDSKLNMYEKENIWLLLSGNDIVWIVGHRVDNRYAVTSATTEVVEFTII